MGNIERKLKKLFDYQKFEKEPELDGVIGGVNSKYSGFRKLTDDELELTAGGMGGGTGSSDGDDPQANGRCQVKDCGSYLNRTPYGFVCPNCGMHYDKNGKMTDPGSNRNNSFF